jgi:nicotinic acid mononucleotide adenylyltransferase
MHDTVRKRVSATKLPERWQARYAAAASRLTTLADILAVREAVAPERWTEGQSLCWIGAPPALGPAPRVGVLSGSFNPLTMAHAALMASAARSLRLSAVVWACSRVTVDKEHIERATLVDRLVQLRAFIEGSRCPTGLAVLRAGLYADQAVALRAAMTAGAQVWLVIGFDKAVQVFDARYYADRGGALRTLFRAANLAVAPRGEHHQNDLAALLARTENQPYARQVRVLPAQPEMASLSSTTARALATRGATIPEMLRLVEPEGAALARVTRAYELPLPDPAGGAIDRYALRQVLLTHLAARPHPSRRNVFERLLERACAPTPGGRRLREALLGGKEGH